MILALEGFDVLHPNYYASIPGFVCRSKIDAYVSTDKNVNGSIYSVPFYEDIQYQDSDRRLLLQNPPGSAGYAAILGGDGYLRPRVFQKSRKVFFGFALCGTPRWYASSGSRWVRNFCSFNGANGGDMSFGYLDVCFINNPYDFVGNSVVPNNDVRFRNGTFEAKEGVVFTCRVFFINDHTIAAQFITGKELYSDFYCSSYKTAYPPIPHSGYIDCDLTDGFVYFEVAVDSDNAVGSGGSAELRLNGKTVYKQENIVGSAYLDWGSDPYSDLSYFRSVGLKLSMYEAWYYDSSPTVLIDDIYIANGDGGVNDDFLGPIKVSSQTEVFDSITDFERSDNGIVFDDAGFAEYAPPFFGINKSKSLNSSIVGSKEENLRTFESDHDDEVVALSVLSGSIGDTRSSYTSSVNVIEQYIKIPGASTYTSESPVYCLPGFHSITENVYNFNPATFSRFKPEELPSIVFGNKHETYSVEKVTGLSAFLTREYRVDDRPDLNPRIDEGSLPILFDGSLSSPLRVSYANIAITKPSRFEICYVDVFCIIQGSVPFTACACDSSGSPLSRLTLKDITPVSGVYKYRFFLPYSSPVNGVVLTSPYFLDKFYEVEIYRIVR